MEVRLVMVRGRDCSKGGEFYLSKGDCICVL